MMGESSHICFRTGVMGLFSDLLGTSQLPADSGIFSTSSKYFASRAAEEQLAGTPAVSKPLNPDPESGAVGSRTSNKRTRDVSHPALPQQSATGPSAQKLHKRLKSRQSESVQTAASQSAIDPSDQKWPKHLKSKQSKPEQQAAITQAAADPTTTRSHKQLKSSHSKPEQAATSQVHTHHPGAAC